VAWTSWFSLKLTRRSWPAVNFTEFDREPSGRVNLIGRVKWVTRLLFACIILWFDAIPLWRSHPDVAEKHYPDLFKQFFPQGLPAQGSAYWRRVVPSVVLLLNFTACIRTSENFFRPLIMLDFFSGGQKNYTLAWLSDKKVIW
jgi:hypothetical protein